MSCFMSFVILVHEYSEREYCCISRYCRMSKGHAIGPVIVPFPFVQSITASPTKFVEGKTLYANLIPFSRLLRLWIWYFNEPFQDSEPV